MNHCGLHGWTLALSLALLPVAAVAQKPTGLPGNYPNKPVKVIVGASPGGGTDIVARLMTQNLGNRWDHSFLVENRASNMGSVIALSDLSKTTPDAYTIMVVSGATYVNAGVVVRMPPNLLKVIEPIAQFTEAPLTLLVHPSVPAGNLNDFMSYVRSNPGKLNYASSGVGASAHLATEYMKHEFKLFIVHIPYKGTGPAYLDLLAGRVHMLFGSPTSAIPYVKKGQLKLMAVTSPKRMPTMPDTPAFAELSPGFEYVSFFGIVGPAGMPRPVVAALNRGLNEVTAVPEVQKQLTSDGSTIVRTAPEDFQKAIISFIGRVEKLVKDTSLDLRTE